jgi:hypothetical protein
MGRLWLRADVMAITKWSISDSETPARQRRHPQRQAAAMHCRCTRSARGDALAISVPKGEAVVLRHFQAQCPMGPSCRIWGNASI